MSEKNDAQRFIYGDHAHFYVPNKIREVSITRSGVTYNFKLPDEIRVTCS